MFSFVIFQSDLHPSDAEATQHKILEKMQKLWGCFVPPSIPWMKDEVSD